MSRITTVLCVCCCAAAAARSQTDTTAVDSVLLKSIEQQMQPPVAAAPPAAQPRSAVSTNPNTSVIGDFQGSYESPAERNFDAYLNEMEVSFQSFVDPYARADFFVSVAREPSGGFSAEPEEVYLTTIDLPAGLQLKAGKFRMAVGRLNTVHPHALPFVDTPLMNARYFGDEGLNDEGVSLSWLVPNPLDFYQELTFEATRTPDAGPAFFRVPAGKYLTLGHLKNFWDLTRNSTLELGFTGIVGSNASGYSTRMGAVDVTYKWKPLQYNTYRSFVWQTEALSSSAETGPPSAVSSWGMYSFVTYQLEQRIFLTGRFDYSNAPQSSSDVERSVSAALGWYATEFQKIELEGKSVSGNNRDQSYQAMLRWIFVIGSHGAHAY